MNPWNMPPRECTPLACECDLVIVDEARRVAELLVEDASRELELRRLAALAGYPSSDLVLFPPPGPIKFPFDKKQEALVIQFDDLAEKIKDLKAEFKQYLIQPEQTEPPTNKKHGHYPVTAKHKEDDVKEDDVKEDDVKEDDIKEDDNKETLKAYLVKWWPTLQILEQVNMDQASGQGSDK
jgi:hypothetical protein